VRAFAAGVTVVTTLDAEGRAVGLTATAFSSLSMEPPLCLVCVHRNGTSHDALVASRRFAVNLLTAEQVELSNRFASRADDKFADVPHRPGDATGCALLDGALASMECEVVDVFPGGDHSIFVGRLATVSVADGRPLLYWRGGYRQLADG